MLSSIDKLGKIHGYYSLTQILLVLVFMMLARIRSVEELRSYAPGEFGKLIGLDRIPEARCLRSKMDDLAGQSHADKWACALSEQWLQKVNDRVGFLYIDGHVKVYAGKVELPRRFVSQNCTDNWAEEEFNRVKTATATGEPVEMKLAERGVYLSKARLLVKEVRKLTERGHQTAIICTAKRLQATQIAPGMFARWSQENYFAYAMHHFNIDALTSHSTESFSGTETVINPRWRDLDRQQRSLTGKLNQMRAKYLAMDTQKRAELSHKQRGQWELGKAQLLDEIEAMMQQLEQIKEAKKEVKRHVKLEELPKQNQFAKLSSSRRTLLNTIAMIAYRAETAMGLLLERYDYPLSQARALLQDLFVRPGDLLPDYSTNILNIHLHSAATPRDNRGIAELLKELNETETVFPNTELKIVFHCHAQPHQGAFDFPRDQEV